MEEQEFREALRAGGFEDGEHKEYAPGTDGPLHTHDFAVMLLVLDGDFTLAREDGATTFRPGEVCELAAGVMHAERTGAAGARVLLGKKQS